MGRGSSLNSHPGGATLLLGVLAALLLAGTAFAQSLDVVKVRKVDGTVVPGFVLEQRDDGLLVRSAGQDVFIPYAEVDEVEHVGSPVTPTPEPAPAEVEPAEVEPTDAESTIDVDPAVETDDARSTEVEPARSPRLPASAAAPPPIVGPVPRDPYLGSSGWTEYTRRRIILTNMRGRPVGPSNLGYPGRDFRRDDDEPYMASVGDRPLTAAEFLELAADERMAARFDRALERANVKVDIGIGMLALSGTLAGFGWPLAVGGGSAGDINAALAGPGLIGWSIATAVIAATLHRSGFGRIAEFNDVDLEELMDRRAAWPAVQRYNGRLRRELGVPDDPDADAEERAPTPTVDETD